MMMLYKTDDEFLRQGVSLLLQIKDSDIRIATLEQGFQAVDRGIHIGGAFSATVPMVSLFYGGFLNLDIEDPASPGQDMFVLSKGHAVATMASIYADLGYFDRSLLKNSRSVESILNGHPGPLLPGVQIATGPLAQGLAVAQGFAMAGKRAPGFNVVAMTGDGELQEGVAWEAIMFAPQKRLDNLCMIVDKNEGQLDDHAQLIFSMDNLPGQIESFGWRVMNIDGTSYSAILEALESFVKYPKDGRPTAIVCNTKKGYGSFSAGLNKHKVTIEENVFNNEIALQQAQRKQRIGGYLAFHRELLDSGRDHLAEQLADRAGRMNLKLDFKGARIEPVVVKTRSGRVPKREKKIVYDPAELPVYPKDAVVAANEVVSSCMSVFARDRRVMSVDADLGSTSGLEGGIGTVDQHRGINVGIAESNMMCVGEAFAALGYNAWVSTFCPFFDWKVMRRIAVGFQERNEAMAAADGWLSDGHGLDLTFLATAPNFETKVNGATHMGNDDTVVYGGIAGMNMIDVSCPNQLVSIMKWVMEGNRGLNYIRIMRASSGVIYGGGEGYEFGKATLLSGDENSVAALVSSGRGVHEILAAAKILEEKGVSASVWDMHSFDDQTLTSLLHRDGLTVIAEQNNGFIWNNLGRMLLAAGRSLTVDNCLAVNANEPDGKYHYIHSATYDQLLNRFGLQPQQIADAVINRLK